MATRKLTTGEFISRCKKVHGDKYDYSKCIYKGALLPVTLICQIHGEFDVIANNHSNKLAGCRKCIIDSSKIGMEEFVKRAVIKYGKKYDYSLVEYVRGNLPVKIICPVHGVFEQTPESHLKKCGQGCPKCSNKCKDTDKTFINKAIAVHGSKYDYSKVIYKGDKCKVEIVCKDHGSFFQSPTNHKQGNGCPKCGHIRGGIINTKSTSKFITDSRKVHGDRFSYDKANYTHSRENIVITCPIHGDYLQLPNNHLKGYDCPACSKKLIVSKVEKEVTEFLRQYETVESNNRQLIRPQEIDIFLPTKNIGIEFNGLHWHSENYIPKEYHLNKLEKVESKGCILIQIFEDEWLLKSEIVKSRLLNIIGRTPTKVYGRQTKVRSLTGKEAKDFLVKNHIQGWASAKNVISYGLFFKSEIVSIITFGLPRKSIGKERDNDPTTWELLRFCNKLNTTVIGGASKLLKYFININKPSKIYSYADRRWSQGNLYETLGFRHVGNTSPNYFYTKGTNRYSRNMFQKSILINKGYDPAMTEKEIMNSIGYFRIYDCGSKKYELILT